MRRARCSTGDGLRNVAREATPTGDGSLFTDVTRRPAEATCSTVATYTKSKADAAQ